MVFVEQELVQQFQSWTMPSCFSENVGLLGVTQVGSRRVVQISAGFMILFSILAAIGLSFLQFTNMNSLPNLFITGVSLFLGLSVSQYFNEFDTAQKAKLAISQGLMVSSSKVPYPFHGPVHTGARWFNDFLNTVFTSAPTIALIIAVFLDNTLQVHRAKKDRGMPWWVKFRTFKGDSRNEEFYTLPFNLNTFFPPT